MLEFRWIARPHNCSLCASDSLSGEAGSKGRVFTAYRYGWAEPIARFNAPWPDPPHTHSQAHIGDGRVFDIRNRLQLRPPAGQRFHPDLTRFALDERFVFAHLANDIVLI